MRLGFVGLLIMVVIVGAAVGGAYGAGIAIGKGSAPAASQPQGASAATGGAAAAAGGAAGGNARVMLGGAGATMGTVQSVSGNTLTVASQAGGTVQVTVSDDTSIRKTVTGAKDDLKQGDEVLITGQPDSGGSITASAIQIVPAGTGGSAGQLRGGSTGETSGQPANRQAGSSSGQPSRPASDQAAGAGQQGAPSTP